MLGRPARLRVPTAHLEEERMTKRRTTWSVFGLLVIVALVASACTAAPGGPTASGAAGQADPNGEITLNTGSEPDTIDPQKSSFVNEIAQAALVFEGLMTFDPKTTKPV